MNRLLLSSFALLVAVTFFANESEAQKKQPSRTVQSPQIAEIDRMIEQSWKEYQLVPSATAEDGEWCRRVFLDVLGRVPTHAEISEFLKSTSKSKREELVNSLLYDEKYTNDFARNWTTVWTNILIGRTGGNDQDSMINRAGMQKYLRDSFARNKPYDQMVRELLTATGSTAPGTEGFNGAVNFMIDKVNEEKAAQATAKSSQIFLGLQVQCTQCHNHPFNDWRQQKYWEMNAFFRQVRARRVGGRENRDERVATLEDDNYMGESGSSDQADLFYEQRNGEMKVAFPVFVDGTPINPDGRVNVVNRRVEFAKLTLSSEYFDKMAVNRMWAHFLGYGFTKPIDDLGSHNLPSHPELLEYLAKEFRQSSYNNKELIKWIVLSRPYGLSSVITKNNESDDPSMGETPKFSHFYLRQMRVEELYESLLVATQAEKNRGSYEEQEAAKNRWLQQFTTAFGTDEGDETTSFNGTIPQILMMFNGDLVNQAVSEKPGDFLDTVAKSSPSYEKCVNDLFIAGLGRKAEKNEHQVAAALLANRKGNATAALADLWWAILNSGEFVFNH